MAIRETFLSAFLQVLFEQMLTSGGRQFLEMVGGVDLPKTIKKWKKDLTGLEALLDYAELQQFHSKPVKLWLNDFQDLAYDIEDLLDHFATEAQVYKLKKAEEDEAYDTMMQNIYASSSRAADSLSTFLKPIRDKIDDITERLQDIQDQSQSLILTAAHTMQQRTLQTETLRSQRESTALVGEVFGRDHKKQEIIKMMLNDDQSVDNYVVIPIVGTGGVGKTTLAQYIYEDDQLKCYFDLKAWVCVSDVFDAKRIMTDIINSATDKSNFCCSNLYQAQLKLKEVLIGKKFFIVLDDIWSEEYTDWEKLKLPFIHGAKGSRVIMTTRIESIAMMMVTNPTQRNIIKLESLSKDDSWLIFQQHANVDPDFAEMRDNIIEKVDGLPLAAKALGSLLKKSPGKSQRKKILKSNVWVQESSVLPVLSLSYHHMPSHLKRVFAYCSVFPKGYKFMEMELVLLWMAQGFLPETQNETMEDMGHKYFNDLLSRSLFEKSPYEEKYIMHDLIHDVAQLAAGDVCYVMDSKSDDLERIRHLFITKHVQTLGKLIKAGQLRTFLCSDYYLRVDNLDIIQRMHCIRALRLVSNQIEVLPDCIGDLKHLRYLSLGFPRIKELPQSINCLLNLQTLCLDDCDKLQKVPYIGSLEKLRYMYIACVRFHNQSKFGRYLSKESPLLKEMPLGIGKLTNLQTLGRFVLAPRGGSRVRELGKLNHLHGSLFISGVENVTEVEDAQEAQLHKKQSLDELLLEWGSCTDEVDDKIKRDVIEKLQPHTNINKCWLDGYMGSTFPSWLGNPSFSNMVDITLKMCYKCECLPPLGQLPSLKILQIEKNNSIKEVGLEFYGHCSSPFPSLKTLSIYKMESWEMWVHPSVDNKKAFPILENLFISHCRSLQGDLPPHLPSLLHLEIRRCESMVSIGHIPLTLKSFMIEDCEKLGCVAFDDQPTNLSVGSDDKKALQTEESVEVSQMASLELPVLLQSEESVEVSIVNCPRLRNFPGGGLPTNLRGLEIRETNIDKPIKEWGLHFLTSLEKLTLENVGSCANTIESIGYPEFPSSLCELNISNFQNLKIICCSTLPELYRVRVKCCPK